MLYLAYAGLFALALIPIYLGSYDSLPSKKGKKKSETLAKEDAYWFPVFGSAFLFGFYLLFWYFGKEYINYLLTAYFAAIGVATLTKTANVLVEKVFKCHDGLDGFEISIKRKEEIVLDLKITAVNSSVALLSVILVALYVYTKHWILNNILGLCFSTSAIALIALDSFFTGFILLSGLFAYDIFWVFGTDVMVSVAKNFDAPIKMLFPRSWGEKMEFSMLGLGDIVIPGIFIALCLKYDYSKAGEKSPFSATYFKYSFIGYIIGLATTMIVMHVFKAAQPALLYLSPACILSVVIPAFFKGETEKIFKFKTGEEEKEEEKKTK